MWKDAWGQDNVKQSVAYTCVIQPQGSSENGSVGVIGGWGLRPSEVKKGHPSDTYRDSREGWEDSTSLRYLYIFEKQLEQTLAP